MQMWLVILLGMAIILFALLLRRFGLISENNKQNQEVIQNGIFKEKEK